MKLSVHATIFSLAFTGVMASALVVKPTAPLHESYSLAISSTMPVPNCPPDTGCPLKEE